MQDNNIKYTKQNKTKTQENNQPQTN